MLRLPLAFGQAHGNITLPENGAVATKTTEGGMDTASLGPVWVTTLQQPQS